MRCGPYAVSSSSNYGCSTSMPAVQAPCRAWLLPGRLQRPAPAGLGEHLRPQRQALCQSSSGQSFSSGDHSRRKDKSDKRARTPGLFEVEDVTPPRNSLGIYALPPNTHNGEQIEIEGQGYVVTSLLIRYKLVKGRYVKDHHKLEVQPTGRYFVNMLLDNLISAKYVGPTGNQD